MSPVLALAGVVVLALVMSDERAVSTVADAAAATARGVKATAEVVDARARKLRAKDWHALVIVFALLLRASLRQGASERRRRARGDFEWNGVPWDDDADDGGSFDGD